MSMRASVAAAVPRVLLFPSGVVSGHPISSESVSSHVVFATTPTLSLVLVDRQSRPALLVPAVPLPDRISLDARTRTQAIGGLTVGSSPVLPVFER